MNNSGASKVVNNREKECKCNPCYACEANVSPDTLYTKPSPLHTTVVVDTDLKCDDAIKQIMNDCTESKHRVVGLDAEWKHKYGMRALGSKIGRIAIVSICSPRGFCALFRMSKLGKVPSSLSAFLEDASIAKVGVGIRMVTEHLWDDFKIGLQLTADLRDLVSSRHERGNAIIRPLAIKIQDIYLNRDRSHSELRKWFAEELLQRDIEFATKDVYASIEIHKEITPTWIVMDFEH